MGPTYDGRTKPDVIAPGVPVTSARSRGGSLGGAPQCDRLTLAGTSMSTPLAAGGHHHLPSLRPPSRVGPLVVDLFFAFLSDDFFLRSILQLDIFFFAQLHGLWLRVYIFHIKAYSRWSTHFRDSFDSVVNVDS